MDQKALGKKIKQIREKYGLTQDEVEKALSLPQKAVTRMEAGQRSVSSLELTNLAELFHRPVSDFFTDDNTADEDLLVTLYRLAPGLESNRKIQEEVAKYVHICREGVLLKTLLNINIQQQILSYPFSHPSNTFEAMRQGEQVARDERRRLGIGHLPIHDIAEMLSSQNIWCAATELPLEMSGLFLYRPSIGAAILVNAHHALARQRFSYAHEYAHALFDQDRHILISETVNARDFIETRANAFAAAFLLPSEGIAEMIQSLGKGRHSRTDLAIFDVASEGVVEAKDRQFASRQKITPDDAALIAHHFGASYQATIYRLHSLQYVSQKEREALLLEESKGKAYLHLLDLGDLEKSEKSPQQRELRTYISRLMIEAYRHEKISRGRLMELARLLGLPGEQLLEIAT